VTYYREKVAATTEQIRNMQLNKKDKLKKSGTVLLLICPPMTEVHTDALPSPPLPGVAFVTFTKVYPARVKINPYINPAKMLVRAQRTHAHAHTTHTYAHAHAHTSTRARNSPLIRV
jgi:hypothetical protein